MKRVKLLRTKFAGIRGIPFVARLTSHIPPGQFARYLVVGAWNTLFGYSTFALFTALLEPLFPGSYVLAMVLSSLVNITVAFLGYKWFVFKTKGNYWKEWMKCMAVYGSGMLPSLFLLPAIVESLRHVFHLGHWSPYVGAALLTGFGVIYSFIGHKKFSFRAAPAMTD